MAREFLINNKGMNVAKIAKTEFEIRDKYRIDIFDNNNEELFLSAVIAINNFIYT